MDTKQQHTAEPWEILDEGDVLEINNGKEAVTSDVFDSSKDPKREKVLRDFRRIVACVNACAGIETEELEQEPTRIIDLLDKALPAIQQRDKLLRARQVLGAEMARLQAMNEALVKQIADGIALQPPAPVHLHGDAAETFRMREQRDKLLAALKALLQEFGETDAIGPQDTLYIARAIIAEIEAAK